MIKNYLVSYFKRVLKYKTQFVITLLSITVGFAIFLCGYYYVSYEYSYDNFQVDRGRLYRVVQEYKVEGKYLKNQLPLASTITKELPGILSYVRLFDSERNVITYKDVKLKAKQGYFADTSFFNFFSFPLIKGNKEAIKDPNSIYLSKDLAYKIFGDNDPLGEVITFDYIGIHLLTVQGIFEVPENSHLQFEWIRSNVEFINNSNFTWDSYNNFITYIKLDSNSDVHQIEKNIFSILKENTNSDEVIACYLQPFNDIYLNTPDECKAHDITKYGNRQLVILLINIGILIMLILWTNLLNVIFVSINNRVKEFTLRKACGANFDQLVHQTFLETVVIVILSGLVAIPLISLLTNIVYQKFGILVRVNILSIKFWLIFAIAIIVNTLVLGLFNYIALKGVPTDRVSRYGRETVAVKILKRGLLLIQLSVTIFIITFILIINKQVNFMMNKDLGIKIDNILLVQDPTAGKIEEGIVNKGKTFMNEIVSHPRIENISATVFPGTRYYGTAGVSFKGNEMNLTVGHIDPNFINTYDVKLLAGRNLTYDINPWTSVLINKKLAVKLGYNNPEDAINNIFLTQYGYRGNMEIVGVIEDYYHLSPENPIEPVIFVLWQYSPNEYYSILLQERDPEIINFIGKKYLEIFGADCMFDYIYLKELYNEQYDTVLKFKSIINLLMIIIAFICCVGVYGFFSAELSKKVKSIAVRRCLGAQKHNILYSLIENYYLFILVASVVTIPISYFIVKEWLNNFANSVELSWESFLIPVVYLIIIILLTIFNKLISALRLNTIDALKCE